MNSNLSKAVTSLSWSINWTALNTSSKGYGQSHQVLEAFPQFLITLHHNVNACVDLRICPQVLQIERHKRLLCRTYMFSSRNLNVVAAKQVIAAGTGKKHRKKGKTRDRKKTHSKKTASTTAAGRYLHKFLRPQEHVPSTENLPPPRCRRAAAHHRGSAERQRSSAAGLCKPPWSGATPPLAARAGDRDRAGAAPLTGPAAAPERREAPRPQADA